MVIKRHYVWRSDRCVYDLYRHCGRAGRPDDGTCQIRFVDRFNHSLFYIEDGDPIQLFTNKGERKFCICHYLDDLHARIDGKEWALWEFAKTMAKNEVVYMPLKMHVEKRKGGAV